ncbi:MAG: ATPase, T2SS/T4P/T4SS family, partial [Candidatus Thiodiazotropha taylori]|nr:Flp pilus assembly complex ATPase component TadA [Candidatus Thiodiazotropha taylori]MCW4243761.1 ATPase, T2SS/T4P/T4SS family [Candidatus Thiodiazotropha taylori]
MSSTTTQAILSGLGRCLIQDGLIDEKKAESAFVEALEKGTPYVTYLVENSILNSIDIAISASRGFGVPIFDLDALDQNTIPADILGEKLIRTHQALPIFKRGNRLFLAVSDPTNHQGLDEIRFNTGLASEAILVEEDKLQKTINKVLDAQETGMDDLLDADLDNLDISSGEAEKEQDESKLDAEEAPVVRYINKILLDAINQGVSDIHFEPYEYTYRIRYRQDGLLHEVATPPSNLANRLTSR